MRRTISDLSTNESDKLYPMANLKEETRAVAKHSSVYIAAAILNRVIGFLMIPIYTRFLTPFDYGIMELIDMSVEIIGMIVSVGIAAAMYRFYFEYESEQERHEVISTSMIAFGTGAFIILALMATQAKPMSTFLFKSEKYYWFLLIAFTYLLFNTIVDMGYVYLRLREESSKYLAYSLTRLSVGVILNIYFVALRRMGVAGMLYSTLVTSGTLTVVLIVPILFKIRIRFSWPKLRAMLRYGLPLMPTNLAAFVVHSSDRFFLSHFSGMVETGLYSLGYKFGRMPNNLIAVPFMQIWEIRFFKWHKDENAHIIFGKIFTYLCFLLVFIGLTISGLIKDALVLISNPSFWTAYKIVPIIVLSYILFSFQYYFNMSIYITKKTHLLAYINGSNAVLNVLLNILLIPKMGMWGAGCATLACFVYKNLVTYIIGNKLYKISFEVFRLMKLFGMGTLVFLACWLLDTGSIYVNLALKFLIIILFPLYLFAFRFYTADEKLVIQKVIRHPKAVLSYVREG